MVLQSIADIAGDNSQYHCDVGVVVARKFIIEHSQLHGKQLRSPSVPEDLRKDGTHCFYNIVCPSNKIQCDDCKRDISKAAKILAEEADLCVSCFSNNEQFPDNYHVINKLDYPLFDQDWTADEELMLFEGLEKHGFGNWAEIAEFIGTNKTREDVEVHYITYFLETPHFMPTAPVLTRRDESGRLVQLGTEEPVKKYQKPVSRIFSSHNLQCFQRGSLTVHLGGVQAGSSPAQIVGYMPKRGDFEVEFDNDAELLLAQMEFNDDDSEEERRMKFRLMEIYNQKLTERVRRKEFVISRKLLDLKEQTRLEKRTKEEKEIYNMMKVFARFSSPEEHEQLVQGLIKEKQVRARLAELRAIKRNGVRSIAELNDELESKKKKENKTLRKDPIFLDSERHKPSQSHSAKKQKKDPTVEKVEGRPALPSAEETELCTRFGITVQQFQVIKQTLVRESLRQGILEQDTTDRLFKVSRSAVQKVLDFVVQRQDWFGPRDQGY